MASTFDIITVKNSDQKKTLRTISDPVLKLDKTHKKLIEKMRKTLAKEETGVGLAAPQIGKNIRIILAVLGKKTTVLINPEILTHSKTTNQDEEGCLSIPNRFGTVERWNKIELKFYNEKFLPKTRTLSDFDARIVQHEIDHLDGVLFIDKVIGELTTELDLED
ncbi:TPA: peptide deformylase [Candidatus Gracilibacteria bacterium]|nr:peptide deformylase [Candidatus Peregrinibacteria bacterium]HIQ56924.1 peptide deformylase [Candidatus Gracilibacteria bacterium]HIQ57592.1 peptide deformylase [Candidatus Gracilibacteria bacterium]